MDKMPTLLIMAAGMGRRFDSTPTTDQAEDKAADNAEDKTEDKAADNATDKAEEAVDKPKKRKLKQITPVSDSGELILDFSLYDAWKAGFRDAVLVIKKDNEKDFIRLLGDTACKKLNIRFAYQEDEPLPGGFRFPEGRKKPWGTGHAILSAKSLIEGPFAAINADDFYGADAFRKIFDFLRTAEDGEKYSYALVAYELGKTLSENGAVTRGVCSVSSDEKLLSVEECEEMRREGGKIVSGKAGSPSRTFTDETPVSMNFWGFTKSIMDELETEFEKFILKTLDPSSPEYDPINAEFLLPNVVGGILKEEKADVSVLHSSAKWHGMTYSEDVAEVKAAVEKLRSEGVYPSNLW